jgi:glycyl-tRNA synthetase
MTPSNKPDDLMQKITSLCKRRGFVFPGSEIYGGLAGTYDYGPLGALLRDNVVDSWKKKFVSGRRDMHLVNAAILMNQKVWQATGHVDHFSDPLVECKKCHKRFRADQLETDNCPACGGEFGEVRQFNMMLSTQVGAAEDSSATSYLRPETAQGIFVNFKNVIDSMQPKLPFGIAQVGKAFRNEITPRDFIFRLREMEQMEIEYFVRPDEWEKHFEYWRDEMMEWMEIIGLDMAKVHDVEIADGDRAHYSSRTIDFEFEYPFGQKELYGLAYRGDYDLHKHTESSGEKLEYRFQGEEGVEVVTPHVIEPSFGLDRTILALLVSAYREIGDGEDVRVYLALDPKIAPYKICVSPLLKNKPELVAKAEEVFSHLKSAFGNVVWDDNGNIGKRYRKQDEIGTPFCVVVDFESLEDESVTVRHRDSGEQERIKISELEAYFAEKLK